MSELTIFDDLFDGKILEAITGDSIGDLITQLNIPSNAQVFVNNEAVSFDYEVKANDKIDIYPTIHGDEGGATVSSIALVSLSSALGLGPLANAIFLVAGQILINRSFAPPEPDVFKDTPTPNYYSWNSQPTQRVGIPIPMVYGRVRIKNPNIIQAYREFDIGENYLNLLANFGLGPIKSLGGYDVNEDSEITLNNTPINNLPGIQVTHTRGLLNQEAVTESIDAITEVDVSQQIYDSNLDDITPQIATITLDSPAYIGLNVTAPSGLYHVSQTTGKVINGPANVAAYFKEIVSIYNPTPTGFWRNFATYEYRYGDDFVGIGNNEITTASSRWTVGQSVYRNAFVNIEPLGSGGYIRQMMPAGWYWEISYEPTVAETDITDHFEGEYYLAGLSWHWTIPGTDNVAKDETIVTEIDLDQYPNFFDDCVEIADTLAISPETKIYLSTMFVGNGKESVASFLVSPIKLPAGTYQIKASGKYQVTSGYTSAANIYFQSILKIAKDATTYPRQALIALKGLASEDVNTSLALSTIVEGKIVNVYNGVTWSLEYSDNQAWVAYDILSQPVISGDGTVVAYAIERYDGLATANLNEDSFKLWADWCDDLVPDGNGGTEKRFTFAGSVDQTGNAWDVALRIAATTRAFLFRRGDKVTAKVDNATSATALFSLGNIVKDSYTESFSALEDRANEFEAEFLNIENNYSKDKLTLVDDDSAAGNFKKNTIAAYGLVLPSQVMRLLNYHLKLNKYVHRTISFQLALDSLNVELGDVFKFQHSVPLWGNGGRIVSATATQVVLDQEVTFEVAKTYVLYIRNANDTLQELTPTNTPGTTDTLTFASVSPVPSQYDLFAFGELSSSIREFKVDQIQRVSSQNCKIEGSEYTNAIYADDNTFIPEWTPIVQADYPVYNRILRLSSIDASISTYYGIDKTVNYEIQLSWVNPSVALYKGVQIEVISGDPNLESTTQWESLGIFQDTKATINIAEPGEYTLRFRTINSLNEVANPTNASYGFITLDAEPSDIANPYITGGVLNLRIE